MVFLWFSYGFPVNITTTQRKGHLEALLLELFHLGLEVEEVSANLGLSEAGKVAYINMYMHIWSIYIYICMYVYVYVYTYICTYYVCIYIYIYVCMDNLWIIYGESMENLWVWLIYPPVN